MTISVGFASFKPFNLNAVGAGANPQVNVNHGDTILQVFDLVTANDMTSHFDPACSQGEIFQLDNTPNTSHVHLALIQRYAASNTSYVMSVGFASPNSGVLSMPFSVNVPGVDINDVLYAGLYPTISNTSSPSVNYIEGSFYPTIKTANTIIQGYGYGGNAYPSLFSFKVMDIILK